MAWMESHQTLRDHPKKDRLAELLFNGSVPNDTADLAAIGLLHCLWWWALDYAQDGSLSKFSDRQIAKGCGWNGDSTLLVASLIDARFVDKSTRHIHDWQEYAGRLLAKRELDRNRKAQSRVRGTSAGQDADAPRDGAGTHTTNKHTQQTDSTDKELMATSVADFETFWQHYPRKLKKQTAMRAWTARVKDKNVPAEMIAAARIYADHCRAGHTEPRYIMHASTFIGPDVPYREWVGGVPTGASGGDSVDHGPAKRPLCPNCEAELTYDGDGTDHMHCPVCAYVKEIA